MSVILLIVVPPKRAKQKSQRQQPYQTSVRKSSRQVTHKVIPSRPQPEASSGAPDQSEGLQATQTNTNKAGRMGRPKNQDKVVSQTQVNSQTININDDTPAVAQQQEGVSRLEFQTLQASMNSMRELFTSFMNNMSPSDTSTNSSQANNSQITEPVVTTQQPITSQPVSVVNNDINIRPPNIPNHSSDVVNQAIAAHISSIVGPQIPGNQSESVSYQLDRKVTDSIMQDIWDEKYIDFNCLLEKSDDTEQGLIIKYSQPGEPLTLVPPKGKSQIGSVKQWGQAFDVFHSVYSRRYPHQTHNLLTYAATVKDLAAQGGDYLRYDQEFRRARSRYGIPWEVPENIMWTSCAQTGLKNHVNQVLAGLVAASPKPTFSDILPTPQPTQPNPHSFLASIPSQVTTTTSTTTQPTKQPLLPNPPNPRKNKDPITHDDSKITHPNGFCYHFHNKGKCDRDGCPYIHACWVPGCGKQHSVYVCPDLARHFNVPIGDSTGSLSPTTSNKTTTNTSRP